MHLIPKLFYKQIYIICHKGRYETDGGVVMEEKEIIYRLQAGDKEALGEIYSLYADTALKTAYLITGDRYMAEDIVQEVFIQVFRTVKSLRKAEAFRAWFYRLLVRYSWKTCSEGKRLVPKEAIADEQGKRDEYFADEKYRELYEGIDRLKPKLRTVIVLYYFNEMSVREIAEATGAFPGTVKSRLYNAKKALRECLKEGFEE